MKGVPDELYDQLTYSEKLQLRIFADYVDNFARLKQRRMKDFDENGMIEVRYRDRPLKLENGRDFITDMIEFFEAEDEGYCYRYCAELVKLLEEYNLKYPE